MRAAQASDHGPETYPRRQGARKRPSEKCDNVPTWWKTFIYTFRNSSRVNSTRFMLRYIHIKVPENNGKQWSLTVGRNLNESIQGRFGKIIRNFTSETMEDRRNKEYKSVVTIPVACKTNAFLPENYQWILVCF